MLILALYGIVNLFAFIAFNWLHDGCMLLQVMCFGQCASGQPRWGISMLPQKGAGFLILLSFVRARLSLELKQVEVRTLCNTMYDHRYQARMYFSSAHR